MVVIGLTGGVGMGKSTAADLLRQRRLPVIDTDVVAREVVEPGQPALTEIQQAFGDVLTPDGRLNRKEMARVVFADPDARRRLEAILHPRIRDRWLAQVQAWQAAGQTRAVVVIPLLFETGAERECHPVICVACGEPSQRQRLAARGWTDRQITQRVAAQWPVARKMELADYVIWTEGSIAIHASQLDRVLNAIQQI